ncbi:transcriptional regulator with XRE-family HTH domain [Sphingomonas sp. F9_3S_D5_B_2]
MAFFQEHRGVTVMNRARLVGGRIKRFRELAALSKSDLARRVAVSPTAVHNWEENGVMPRIEVMLKLEKALEVSWMQLMSGIADDDSEPRSTHSQPSPSYPEVSRGDRLDQFRRQIAALFEVTPDRVDIVIRT